MAVSAATYTCQTHRYKKCFNELCTIGKGGYATVYQAQHNLDKGIYAVKKISFRYKSDEKFEKIRCEAERLAQLNHPNVVSYNSAWLEIADDAEAGSECETCSNSESSTGEILDRNDHCLPTENFPATALPVLSLTNNETYRGNVEIPEVVKEKKSQSPGATGLGPLQPNLRRRRHSSGPTCSDTDFLKEEIMLQNEDNMGCKNIEQPTVKKSDLRVNFYIQMEYCNHDLNFWLSSQNSNTGYSVANEQKPVEVFHQILCGVEYIHSQSVIHRDLKPSNIFILAKHVAKIGDFGLACLVDQTNDSAIKNLSYTRGTPPYAAPEQKESHKYDSKVDIYSLGIVLLELLHPCETRQEFCGLVENAGNGIFPSYLNQNRREYVKLITQMMNIDPVKRPTATEILRGPLFKTKSANRRIEEIKHRLVKLSEEQKELAKITCDLQAEQNGLLRESMSDNKELRGQNSAQKEEIENLRKELAEHCV